MRNRPQHGPRGGSKGPRQHQSAQGRGPRRGRRQRRHHSPHPEEGRQEPSQARSPRRHRPPVARGNWGHQPPRGRRNLRRSAQANFRPHHPMRDIFLHHNRMRHVFDRRFAYREGKTKRGKSNWRPPIEFSVSEDRYEVLVELPGVSQNDVTVSVTDNLLKVKGKKERKQTDETQHPRRSELRYGSFKRVLPLPPNAKADGIKAEFKDGVLTIEIPKTEEAKPTEIPINVEA
ncbi:Hsp20/alpha crystallin family protein [Candidatus Poribacteria bacterium]|nr:Hsp20/alpha crystallin family protein [Candidatus Poribacteria bacterium]